MRRLFEKLRSTSIAAVAFAASVLPGCIPNCQDDVRAEVAEVIEASPEPTPGDACVGSPDDPEVLDRENTIQLGNVCFVIQNPEVLLPGQREGIFDHMREAYRRLANYFGEDVMLQTKHDHLPIIFDAPDSGKSDASLQYSWQNLQLLPNGDVHTNEVEALNLTVRVASLANFIHEFVHLFLQGDIFFTDAFTEGHAHLIEDILAGTDGISSASCLEGVLSHMDDLDGLFTTGLDTWGISPKLTSNGEFDCLRRHIWEHAWVQFSTRHPDFLAKFYRRIYEKRLQGQDGFSKSEIVEIISLDYPDFPEWYETVNAFKYTGDPSSVSTYALIFPDGLTIITNYRAIPQHYDVDTGAVIPARVEPVYGGHVIAHRPGTDVVEYSMQDFTGDMFVAFRFSKLNGVPDSISWTESLED